MKYQFNKIFPLLKNENTGKPHFGPDFGSSDPIWAQNFFSQVLPQLDVRHCRKLSSYSISRKTYDPNSVTRYHGQVSSCKISEKANDPNLRKFSDRRTNGRTDRQADRRSGRYADGQTDASDFIERCPIDVERPIITLMLKFVCVLHKLIAGAETLIFCIKIVTSSRKESEVRKQKT